MKMGMKREIARPVGRQAMTVKPDRRSAIGHYCLSCAGLRLVELLRPALHFSLRVRGNDGLRRFGDAAAPFHLRYANLIFSARRSSRIDVRYSTSTNLPIISGAFKVRLHPIVFGTARQFHNVFTQTCLPPECAVMCRAYGGSMPSPAD